MSYRLETQSIYLIICVGFFILLDIIIVIFNFYIVSFKSFVLVF